MKLDAARLDALVWALVFGGLVVVAIGVALDRIGAGYGWGVVAAGATIVAAGVAALWLRSRMRDPES